MLRWPASLMGWVTSHSKAITLSLTEVLMDRLSAVGVHGRAWSLLKSFLTGRTQTVDLGSYSSRPFVLPCGVPQGSSLSPTLFNIYVISLAVLIRSFGFYLTSYADDTQIVLSIKKGTEDKMGTRCHDCMQAVAVWMSSHCLKRNAGKTEVLIFGNNANLWSPAWWPDDLGSPPVPTTRAKNLRVIVDVNLSFKDHISKVISLCFLILRILRKIKFLLPEESLKTVVTALILSRLDYCNSLYINAQKGQLARLQTVQNAAARLVTGTPRFVSVRSGLRALHWLPIWQRIQFKVLCLVFKALNGMGPMFETNDSMVCPGQNVALCSC